MSRQKGFTLVELMIVVALIAMTSAVAVYSMRTKTGETAPALARGVLGLALEARQSAVSIGQSTRIRLVPTGANTHRVVSEKQEPTTGVWGPLGGTTNFPSDVQLCAVSNAAVLTGSVPACPLATDHVICFAPNGSVRAAAGAVCPAGARTGATVYLHSIDDTTGAPKKRYKIVIWPLTGLPKLMDTW